MLTRVFIVGFPRSGTTLLQSLLAAHTKVHSFPETHFWATLAPSNRAWRSLGLPSKKSNTQFHRIRQETGAPASFASLPFLPTINRRVLARAFVKLLDSWTLAQGCTHWVEKTPRHLHHISQIDKDVPQPQYIHILRNGPEAVASLYDATKSYPEEWGGERSIEKCVERWCSDVERSLSMVGMKRHYLVRYEDLTSNPGSSIRQCCQFLHLDFEPSQLKSFGSQEKALVRPEEHWKKQDETGVIRGPDSKKFLRVFSLAEQKYVQENTLSLQKKLEAVTRKIATMDS